MISWDKGSLLAVYTDVVVVAIEADGTGSHVLAIPLDGRERCISVEEDLESEGVRDIKESIAAHYLTYLNDWRIWVNENNLLCIVSRVAWVLGCY